MTACRFGEVTENSLNSGSPPPEVPLVPAGPATPHERRPMDFRLAPAEHYDLGAQMLESVGEDVEPIEAYLYAIAHFLAGLLRSEMS